MKTIFFPVLLLISVSIYSQIPKNLVFEGSGIRGIAFAGAVKELENQKMMDSIERVGGTSAGAITALLLSLHYSADEITKVVHSTPYRNFNDGRFLFIGGMNRLQKYFGWYRGRQLEKWIGQLIAAKAGNDDIRFSELKQRGFKQLYVTGTSLNQQKLIIFSHENYPNMKVKDAIRISVSIPLYFEAVHLDSMGNIGRPPKTGVIYNLMIDGGLTGNFPIKIFDSTKYFSFDKLNEVAINKETIGFRIDREEQIANDNESKGLAPMPVNDIQTYLGAFYNMILESLNRQTLTAEDWKRTVSINDGAISPRIRKLSTAELNILIKNGQDATRKFLKGSGK